MRRSTPPTAMSCRCCNRKYDWSACTLSSGYVASNSGRVRLRRINDQCPRPLRDGLPTNFIIGNTGADSTIGPGGVAGAVYRCRSYNYGALNYFQRPDERYTGRRVPALRLQRACDRLCELHVHGRPHVGADRALRRLLREFRSIAPIPFLEPKSLRPVCGGSTAGYTTESVHRPAQRRGRRPRISSIEHTDLHEVLGVKGKIDDGWSYDASLQHSLVNLISRSPELFFDLDKIDNALNVTGTAANPVIACASGPPCVPYNIFQPGGVTASGPRIISRCRASRRSHRAK